MWLCTPAYKRVCFFCVSVYQVTGNCIMTSVVCVWCCVCEGLWLACTWMHTICTHTLTWLGKFVVWISINHDFVRNTLCLIHGDATQSAASFLTRLHCCVSVWNTTTLVMREHNTWDSAWSGMQPWQHCSEYGRVGEINISCAWECRIVCIRVSVCAPLYVYLYTACLYLCVWVCQCGCMSANLVWEAWMYNYMHLCVHVYVVVYVCVCWCVCGSVWMCACVRLYA